MKTTCTVIIVCLLTLSGCSKQEFYKTSYELLQPDIFACDEVPLSQYKQCIAQVQKAQSYEEYQKERKNVTE